MREQRQSDLQLCKRLLQEIRPCAGHIVGLMMIGILATPLALLMPVPLKIAVDSLLGDYELPKYFVAIFPKGWTEPDSRTLVLIVCILVAIVLLDQLRHLAESLLSAYTGEKLLLNFRAKLFNHVQRLSFAYHDSKGIADSMYRIQNDTYAVRWLALSGIIPLVSALFTLTGIFYVTARIDWELALVALVVFPMLILTTVISKRRIRRGWDAVKGLDSAALGVVQEVLGGLRVVKAFGQERREHARFVDRSDRGRRARLRVELLDGIFAMTLALTTGIGTAAVLWIGVHHEWAGKITVGNLILVMGYLGQLYVPARNISRTITTLQSALASAARAFDLLDESPDVLEKSDALPLKRAEGTIMFRGVSFAYNGGDQVLRRVSLEVPAGTVLGLTGVTGAGKTTLINLLSRFYDPNEGEILLDGVDLRDYRLADLRQQFALVLQEPVLFSSSIAENIAYARPNATERDVIEAAKTAHAHEFIVSLPDGYQTHVGERGMRLSGGERQRISLARAFLKNAPVLILDEPTSSVDIGTESLIMESMERLMEGRTTLLITHRLPTLRHCDRVVRIEHGVVHPWTSVPSAVGTEESQAVQMTGER